MSKSTIRIMSKSRNKIMRMTRRRHIIKSRSRTFIKSRNRDIKINIACKWARVVTGTQARVGAETRGRV